MDKNKIIEKLRAFPYDPKNYWVVTGGAMVLHGIREETPDIDLGCTPEMADRLESEGFLCQKTSDGNRWFKVGSDIEIFENWLYDKVELAGNIPVISLRGLLAMKNDLGRKKDMRDVLLIQKHMCKTNREDVSLRESLEKGQMPNDRDNKGKTF